jgi:hypothetical protein
MPYTSTTLADLQTLMVQRWDSIVFWTAEEARLALNEALREWNLLTGRWRTRVLLSVSAGDPEVALPGAITYGMRLTTALGAPLIPTSVFELDFGRPSWRFETTASGSLVPTVPTLWAPLSLTRLAIWPTYPVDTPTALVLDGVMRTPVLVAAGDTVDLGEEIIDPVIDMALHVAAFKEAGDRWRATRVYFEAFLQAAADENGLLKQNQAYRRWAGLDRRRDLQPSTGASSQMQGVATQFSRHDQAEQG